jgi:formate dehydrogenase iron-sulfur subunit
MGGLTPMPVRSAIEHFPDDFYAKNVSAKTEGKP